MNNEALFFKDKPIFGFDIGNGSLKVMQIDNHSKEHRIVGYGASLFDPSAIKDGVIVDAESIAKSALDLFNNHLVGRINTRRVVLSVPAARSFNRNFHLPKLNAAEIKDAILSEIDQYIPVSREDLYYDHTVLRETNDGADHLIVAVPKKIVDTYMDLAKILNLEVVGIETNIDASGQLFLQAENGNIPTVLMDLGSTSADLTIYDGGLIVTGTIPKGGDDFTDLIATTLGVTNQEAHIIKTKYGLGVSKKQKEITQGLEPVLRQIVKEIRRMIRYYEERSGSERTITQIVTMGGGANMPGLSDYLTESIRIPTRTSDPWQNLHFGRLQLPHAAEKSMYVTVAGLALTQPKELFT